MYSFWTDRPPLFVHRILRHQRFEGQIFACVDEGDERTVISPDGGEEAAGPFSCLTMGPFDLSAVGVLAKASAALAEENIPIFVISTYRHDHILVPRDRKEEAAQALSRSGFERKV